MTKVSADLNKDPFLIYKNTSDTGDDVYSAGYPSYPANFTRDTLKAGILSGRSDILASQLEVSARHQGSEINCLTGEWPGKIHHEMPGAQLEGRQGYTTYNACDSTALFLIGVEALLHLNPHTYHSFLTKRRRNIEQATDHIMELVDHNDELYWERTPEGASDFTLRVTYWKDSILPHADGKLEPTYPVTFALAHFIAARGLLSASRILERPDLAVKADKMYRAGIARFMKTDDFVVYIDSDGELRQSSSDELHSLAYIPLTYSDVLRLDAIKRRSKDLSTTFGYMCTPHTVAELLSDKYHGDKVWVFEQANIHYGATKFGLTNEALVAASIAEHIGEGQELFGVQNHDNGTSNIVPEGNPRQLWSVAAAEYFAGNSLLVHNAWL